MNLKLRYGCMHLPNSARRYTPLNISFFSGIHPVPYVNFSNLARNKCATDAVDDLAYPLARGFHEYLAAGLTLYKQRSVYVRRTVHADLSRVCEGPVPVFEFSSK